MAAIENSDADIQRHSSVASRHSAETSEGSKSYKKKEDTKSEAESAKEEEHTAEREEDDEANDTESNAGSTQVSETSTQAYEQEPFESFKDKVAQLALQLFPDHSKDNITIERLEGGDNNRIIGLTVQSEPSGDLVNLDDKKSKGYISKLKILLRRKLHRFRTERSTPPVLDEYVLRTPRYDDDNDLIRDAALLRFAEGVTDYPTPKIVKLDTTANNPLGAPYVLLQKLPGTRLDAIWDDLNHKQRLDIAKQVAEVLKQLVRTVYSSGGRIDPSSISNDDTSTQPKDSAMKIAQFGYDEESDKVFEAAESIPPAKLVQDRLRTWKAIRATKTDFEIVAWNELAKLAGGLDGTIDVPLSNSRYHVHHGDLYPRNILIQIVDESTVKISGILDWDETVIVPAVVAFESPCWLWRYEEYKSGDLEQARLHKGANEMPTLRENQETKQVFEEAVGSDFLQYAYHQHGDVARWLWDWARKGLHQSWIMRIADEALKEYEVELEHPYGYPTALGGYLMESDDDDASEENGSQEAERDE